MIRLNRAHPTQLVYNSQWGTSILRYQAGGKDAAQAEEAAQIYASAGATMKCGTVYAVGYKI